MDFDEGGIRSKKSAFLHEKQVCLKIRDVVNKELEQEDAEWEILDVDLTR